jgi:hypothetical protein
MALPRALILSSWQIVAVVLYSAAFPLAGLVGDSVVTVALFAALPFLCVGYFFGSVAVAIIGVKEAYPVGLFLATFIQVWLLIALWNSRERKL